MKKNENYLKYVQAMHLMDEGKSITYLEKNLRMSRPTIKLVRRKYLMGGELALIQPLHQPHVSVEKKLELVREVDKNLLSLRDIAYKNLIQPMTLSRWVKAYHKFGSEGLVRSSKPQTMKKRQRTEAEMDELEKLRKRNEYLEAENALLKKVKALVEEREARLREIGRKPSKD